MAESSTLSEEKLADFLQKQDERFSKLLTNALLPIIAENKRLTDIISPIITENTKHAEQRLTSSKFTNLADVTAERQNLQLEGMEACLVQDDKVGDVDPANGGDYQEVFTDGYFYMESKDDEGRIEVFTDGACSRKNGLQCTQGGCGVWFGLGHPHNESFPLLQDDYGDYNQTHNRAELLAAYAGLCKAYEEGGFHKVRLFTDSRYVFDGITSHIYKWEVDEWQTFERTTVTNIDLWKKMRSSSLEFEECVVQWVPRAHPQMKRVNRMAKHAAAAAAAAADDEERVEDEDTEDENIEDNSSD